MNTIYRLTTLFALTLSALGADVKFSALPTATSPSTNSYVPIIDLNLLPAAQNEKYLLTNLATVAQLNTATNALTNYVTSSQLTTTTNSLTNSFVLKAGDTMTGALTVPNIDVSTGNTRVGPLVTGYFGTSGLIQQRSIGDISLFLGSKIAFFPGDPGSTTADTYILRDAANTLALRNGANAQTFNLYKTYTDASNYEKLMMGQFSATSYVLGTYAAGTGTTTRNLVIGTSGAGNLYFMANGNLVAHFDGSAGHLLFDTDNTYDIGASGANRPRNVYIGTSLIGPNGSKFTDGGGNGVWTLYNSAATGYDRLQFGGVTASFPSIKRNGTAIESRLADDSNYAPLNAPWQQSGYTKVCTSASSNALFYVSVPSTNMIGGRVLYTVSSTDGTDAQQITGTAQFGAVGKGTAVTANVTDVQNTSTVSAGTLTASLTANVSTNNTFALMITPVTSLTTTNLQVRWRLETPSTFTITPL